MAVRYLLEQFRDKQLLSEDNEKLTISLNDGLTPQNIDRYENQLQVKLPEEFKELLMFSNGMDFFGLQILPLNKQEFISAQSMISFHNWGNGDFDCIVVDSQQQQYPSGQVVFRDHQTNLTVPVTGGLEHWFQKVYTEMEHHGCLRHPMDYSESKADSKLFFWRRLKKKPDMRDNTTGLYANVKEMLKSSDPKQKQSKKGCSIEREYYKDGSISNEYVYVDGRLHGISRGWHKNGQLANEGHHKNGKSHGPNIIWDENGKLIAEGYFKNGRIWEGEFLFVDENKNEFIEKYAKGKLISSAPSKK